MDQYPSSNNSVVQSGSARLQTSMAQVYGWMGCGMLLTAVVSWYAAHTPAVISLLFSSRIVFFGLIIVQLGLVFVLSGLVHKLSGGVATTLFMLYSALTGLTMSSIFIVYTWSSIAAAFFTTAGMFGVMSAWGYTTKRDLSGFGNMLFMALIGLVLASVVNIFLHSNALMWAVTYLGVLIFVGLTAYDTQKIRQMATEVDLSDANGARRFAIIGALTLYLDFINLFLMLLRIFGDRR